MRRSLMTIFTLLALGYAALCVYFWVNQERLLFFPKIASQADLDLLAATEGYELWTNPCGERIGWKSRGDDPSDALLICHGNGGYALGEGYAPLRNRPASAARFQTFLLEYPGYGARPGPPSAKSMTAAAIEAIDTLTAGLHSRIFLLGQSLGTGVACAAAAARPAQIAGIILVTPYDSLAAGAQFHHPWLPVALLLRHHLDSDKNLIRYHGPVAFLIAGRDGTIPPQFGRRLYDGYSGTKRLWLASEAGHNDLGQLLAAWPQIVTWLHERRQP
ncbi:MAG: alpha/beta hydrolase [Terrimicrobiaceae bacterium]|nr:alpha/beta hydrolase [Terrimicrobiaceae bacterium]